MSPLRDTENFPELLRTAAADLSVPAALIEKDCWLAQVSDLVLEHPQP